MCIYIYTQIYIYIKYVLIHIHIKIEKYFKIYITYKFSMPDTEGLILSDMLLIRIT